MSSRWLDTYCNNCRPKSRSFMLLSKYLLDALLSQLSLVTILILMVQRMLVLPYYPKSTRSNSPSVQMPLSNLTYIIMSLFQKLDKFACLAWRVNKNKVSLIISIYETHNIWDKQLYNKPRWYGWKWGTLVLIWQRKQMESNNMQELWVVY